ncbi:MAG: hypothetical protein C0507_15475 [Cyanobacteria bacterium PR.3.49]|nr:hypothetical protein [Cyanobacteria bacterium PR.3.49]
MPKFDPWSNQPIRLFHGTTRTNAERVYKQIDHACGRMRTDFGRGFYTTTWFDQAKSWAINVSNGLRGEKPAVIYFDVDRLELSLLDSLFFVRGASDAEDYWALVNHCRLAGGCHHSTKKWYDVVVGPVTALAWRKRKTHSGFDQISFHSTKAAAILDKSKKSIIDVN